ncbi:MAG: apolipoprotein N-acyltransferase, partial [Thioalkalivibrio sp.]|nr:apolipoprotein N-acyltransferase [Thioalkalivibrio sp.]
MLQHLPRWATAGLALGAGAAGALAFAPLALFPLAPLALALWFALLLGAPPSRAAGLGYLFGLGFFGVGTTWIFNSLLVFGQAPLVVATTLTVLFVLVMAAYPP